MLRRWTVVVTLALVVGMTPCCVAQGLRISTHVYDVSKSDSRTAAQIVNSSLTLCHNGRVYDSVDSADEVVVFDPVERRFTILNNTHSVTTRLTFDEIRHLMDGRRERAETIIKELTDTGKVIDQKMAKSIKFQLDPVFSQTFDPMRGTLVLQSPSFTYRVETRKWDDPQQVERYLVYADWTAKLNAILHPGSLFPEPRLALNDELRKLKDRIPVSVELDFRPNEDFRLRADHSLTQKLSDDDHARIARWEKAIGGTQFRVVSFQSYQKM